MAHLYYWIHICTNFLQKLRLKIILKLYTKMTIFWCVRTTWQNCPLVYMYLTFAISILNLQYRDWILTSKRKYTVPMNELLMREVAGFVKISIYIIFMQVYGFHENVIFSWKCMKMRAISYIIWLSYQHPPAYAFLFVLFVSMTPCQKTFTLLELHYISYGVMAVEWVDLR